MLATASQLSQADAPLSQAKFIEKPKFVSLKIGDFVISNYKKCRIGGNITAISADEKITVFSAVMDKTVIVTIADVTYKRVDAYEIE